MKKPKEIKETVDTEVLKSVSALASLISENSENINFTAKLANESFRRISFINQRGILIWAQIDLMLLSLVLGSSGWALVPSIGSLIVLGLIIKNQLEEGKRVENFIKNL